MYFPKAEEISPQFRFSPDLSPIEQRDYLVDGQIHRWDGAMKSVQSPIYLNDRPVVVGSYPLLAKEQAMAALAAAAKAYDNGRGSWPTSSVQTRIAHVETFVRLMKTKRDEVVRLLMWEIGKNLADSEKEFDRTIEYIVDTIQALKELDRDSSRLVIEQGIIAQIRRAPLGVTLCMGPYNYPLNETFTTLIPALIMGNTIILKPAKFGVLLHGPLLTAYRDAFPAGVINTLYGSGSELITPIMAAGQINALAFIGTSKVANLIRTQHPKQNRLRCVLGLEAKNVAVVLADADIEMAVRECLLGALSFNGQRCTALKMIFVQQALAPQFVQQFAKAVDALKLGMPWENTPITPLPEPDKVRYLSDLLVDAQSKGAQVVNAEGGKSLHSLFSPAVLYPVNAQMRLWHEEQFGPIVPIVPFEQQEEPIRYIEESNYGQQVSLFGTNAETMARLIDHLVNQVCRVNVNSQCQRGPDLFPFTGRKDSAEGTLSVSDALRVFSIRTLVAAKEGAVNKRLVQEITYHHKSNFLTTDYIL